MQFLSFDIEDWYISYASSQIPVAQWSDLEDRIPESTKRLLDMLERHDLVAHFFLLGWVARRHPALVKEIAKRGHPIGFHSMDHTPPNLLSPDAFRKDLREGLALLSGLTGEAVTHYRAPGFGFNGTSAAFLPILAEEGILLSSSFKGGDRLGNGRVPNAPFRIETPAGRLLELPLGRKRLFPLRLVWSGSGYFRLLPGSVLCRLHQQEDYTMWYFHPRDFDPSVPSTPLLPWYRNLMSRLGNRTAEARFAEVLPSRPISSMDPDLFPGKDLAVYHHPSGIWTGTTKSQ